MSYMPIHGHSIKLCKEINDALHEQERIVSSVRYPG